MTSPAREFCTLLEDSSLGLGLSFGVDLFLDLEPTTPNFCVVVRDTGGYEPNLESNMEKPTIQVRVRASDYKTAYDTIKTIFDAYRRESNVNVGNTRFILIRALGSIMSLGKDDNNRSIEVVNFVIFKTEQ